MTFGTWRWWGCQPQVPAAFTPRKCSWYSFSLGAESTPGPWYGRKEYVTETSSDTTGNRSRDRPQRLNHYATPGPFLRYYTSRLVNGNDRIVLPSSLGSSNSLTLKTKTAIRGSVGHWNYPNKSTVSQARNLECSPAYHSIVLWLWAQELSRYCQHF